MFGFYFLDVILNFELVIFSFIKLYARIDIFKLNWFLVLTLLLIP